MCLILNYMASVLLPTLKLRWSVFAPLQHKEAVCLEFGLQKSPTCQISLIGTLAGVARYMILQDCHFWDCMFLYCQP